MLKTPPNRHHWNQLLVVMIVGGTMLWQFIGAWQDSQTTDEAVHLAAGVSYWRTGDWRLNPEHPPLTKLLAAIPLLALRQLHLPLDRPAWSERNQWLFGAAMVYGSIAGPFGPRLIMWLGRWPMIVLWGAIGLLIYSWSRQRWGPTGGLVSLTFFAFDPNWLGHGHLVTNDVAAAGFFFASVWALDRLARTPTWSRVLILTVLFAAAQLSKFSNLILWIIIPLVGAVIASRGHSLFRWRWWWRMMVSLALITPVLIWTTYGFEIERIDQDPRINQLWQERQWLLESGQIAEQRSIVQQLVRWTDPNSASGQWVTSVLQHSIPAYSYWRGVFSTMTHNYAGHAAYLFGQFSLLGWWYYFPVALAVKTPLVTVVLLLVAGWLGWERWRRHRRWPDDVWLLGLPPLLYFLWSLTSHINIGLRHIFPVYPFLWLWLGSLAAQPWPRWPGLRHWVIGLGLSLSVMTAFRAGSNTIGYFNALVGGTAGGHRVLLDSNLDWNQDLWRLRSFLNRQRFPEVHIVLFGSVPLEKIFPGAKPVLTDDDVGRGRRPSGVVTISAGQLYNVNGPFKWLRSKSPQWRIGSSILVYDFR
ncbi:MAG: glycosyltransferase family 39 protein [Candidatus Kerfeldbacteria bacterium]|nr:glycosyltransferase family 39 protein [Candidatus Kerfeldbacteria bacterium]